MKRIAALALAALCLPFFASAANIAELKATAEAAVKAANAAPSDYSANWKATEALRRLGDELENQGAADWKTTAKAAAKDGMKYGEIAQKLNPNGIEGWYWYGLCVGTYSDCVSIVTALSEGLKGKTQKGFEMAYQTNKMYDKGGPMLSLGRFWMVLPGIAGRDVNKAISLFSEYIGLFDKSPDPNSDAWYWRGSLYKEQKKMAEARADLERAAALGSKEAAQMLATLK